MLVVLGTSETHALLGVGTRFCSHELHFITEPVKESRSLHSYECSQCKISFGFLGELAAAIPRPRLSFSKF